MQRNELTAYLDRTLNLAAFAGDVSNNGLQVEGRAEVRRIAVGVDASQALFDAAAGRGADLVLVHHGLSWGGEPRRFTGLTARRLGTLFRHEMSLYAVHLPLDAHPRLGNNARLADLAGLTDRVACCEYHGMQIGFAGNLPAARNAADLAADFEKALVSCRAECFDPLRRPVRRAVVVSGGGGMDALDAAVAAGAELLITGEFTQIMYHPALESGLAVIALGHYASETVGVRAVLAELQREFKLDGAFIDLPTGR